MRLLSVILFASSSNLDNVIVGISYGVKKIHIPILANFLIASITSVGTVLSMLLGKYMSYFIPTFAAKIIGSVILIGIGTIGLIKYLNNREPQTKPKLLDNPEKYDKNKNSRIECKEAISLGLALSANNIGLGLGASVSGLPILPAAIATFVFSLAYIYLGNFFGSGFLSNIMGKYAEPVGCLGIIALGIFELVF